MKRRTWSCVPINSRYSVSGSWRKIIRKWRPIRYSYRRLPSLRTPRWAAACRKTRPGQESLLQRFSEWKVEVRRVNVQTAIWSRFSPRLVLAGTPARYVSRRGFADSRLASGSFLVSPLVQLADFFRTELQAGFVRDSHHLHRWLAALPNDHRFTPLGALNKFSQIFSGVLQSGRSHLVRSW